MPTTQPSLELLNADGSRPMFVRPMVGVETFKAMTGRDEDEMLAEILTGKVRWAFNLSVGAQDRNNFVRIWVRSIDCFRYPHLFKQPDTVEKFLDQWLPPVSKLSGALFGTTLQKLLNVSGDHVADLIAARLLTADRRTVTTGPKGSPKISRASVEALLRRRWMGANRQGGKS